MAEAHEWTLRRLREMTGRLTEQAYICATEAGGYEEDAPGRWMLIFDRMARGLRLTIALEAKQFRERRWDADEIQREASGVRHEPRWRKGAPSEPCEADRERDDDGLPSDATLPQRIARLTAIIEGAGAPEPEPILRSVEIQAINARRAKRARRAGTPLAPDEPWDILTAADRAEFGDAPYRGSG